MSTSATTLARLQAMQLQASLLVLLLRVFSLQICIDGGMLLHNHHAEVRAHPLKPPSVHELDFGKTL